jgi:hypothetical protein
MSGGMVKSELPKVGMRNAPAPAMRCHPPPYGTPLPEPLDYGRGYERVLRVRVQSLLR